MTKTLTLIFAFCCLVFGFEQFVLGQTAQVRTSTSQPAEMTNREQDGLKGPVRRVRVETSTILIKGGEVSEGPRVVRGVSTYDAAGKKIDSVDYAIESSAPPGKERYLYDKNGNIVEMDVVGNDGSVLSKEFYEYETDQLGNWTKRRTLVAIYENGKVTSEPMEVTYRSISYYYNQAIEKLSAAAPRSKSAAPSSVAPVRGAVKDQSKPLQQSARNQTTSQTAAEATSVALREPAKEAPSNRHNDAPAVEPAPKEASEVAPAATTTNTAGNTSTPVLKVTEDVLRSAAMELPQPEFPVGAVLKQTSEKIEVQLLIDTKGNVTNARATSGNPLLAQAAETAALKARFSTAKLSPNAAALVFGAITYDFALPAAAAVTPPATNPPTERRSQALTESKVAAVETKPITTSTAPTSDYERGMTFLAAGSYEEAATAFNRAVQVNPNDANAYVKLAMSYSGMHKEKEALAGFKMASQINRNAIDARAYYMWGGSYLALGKPSEAISAFKQALAVIRSKAIRADSTDDPNAPSAEQLHQGLGIAYMNSNRFNDAVKAFQQVVLLNPQNADAHYALAMAYLVNGDRASAENQNRILASLNPEMAQKVKAAISTPVAPGCRNIACR
jgi:tetratricopeptide (TPR) repeat protein